MKLYNEKGELSDYIPGGLIGPMNTNLIGETGPEMVKEPRKLLKNLSWGRKLMNRLHFLS